MLTADLVEAFDNGKSASKLLTRAGDIEARINTIAFQQQAISAATRRLGNIRTAADKTDKAVIAWRSKCQRIDNAWNRIQREADTEFPVDAGNGRKANYNAKRRGRTPPVSNREHHRAFVEAEVIRLAEDIGRGRFDK